MPRRDDHESIHHMSDELKLVYWHLGMLNSDLLADFYIPFGAPHKSTGLHLLCMEVQQNPDNHFTVAILCYVQEVMSHRTRDLIKRVELNFDGVAQPLLEQVNAVVAEARKKPEVLHLLAALNAKYPKYKNFSYLNILRNYKCIFSHCEAILDLSLDPMAGWNNDLAFKTVLLYCDMMSSYQEADNIEPEIKNQRLVAFKKYWLAKLQKITYQNDACSIAMALQIIWYQLPKSERQIHARDICLINGTNMKLSDFFGKEITPILDNLLVAKNPDKARLKVLKKLRTAAPYYDGLITTLCDLLHLEKPLSFAEEVRSILTNFFETEGNEVLENYNKNQMRFS